MFRTVVLNSLPPLKKSLQLGQRHPTIVSPEAHNLVRIIFSNRRDELGLSAQQIYRDGVTLMPDRPAANGDHKPTKEVHPFRSMRHLKECVLEDLAKAQQVEKVFVRIKERVPNPPSDDSAGLASPKGPDPVEIVASVSGGQEQTVKVVLPQTGQVSDKFWIWRALPALFAPSSTGETVQSQQD